MGSIKPSSKGNNPKNSFLRLADDPQKDLKMFQSIIDSLGASVVVLDEHRNIVLANRAWRQFAARTGAPSAQHGLGKTYPEVFSYMASTNKTDADGLRAGVQSVIDHSAGEFETLYKCTALAEPSWFRMHAAPFTAGGSYPRLILVSHYDLTTPKTANEEEIKRDEFLRRLISGSNIIPWEANYGNKRYSHIGEQAERLLGYTANEWTAEGFWRAHLHPADRDRVVAEFGRLSRSRENFRCEYRMVAKDGRSVWIDDMVCVMSEWPNVPKLRGLMTDITERKHVEFLAADLGGRLITAQEEERKRIARELHDDLNQRIALISIELEQAAQALKHGTADVPGRLGKIQQKVSEISTEIHRMSYELHPSKLDHLGLVPALNSFCSDLASKRRMKIDFTHKDVPAELSRDITLCLFRVAQEALQNAAKHSGTCEVTVSLKGSEGLMNLTVSDKGNGFVPSPEKMARGLGLTSIRERVRLVNGDLRIITAPSYGTRIHITVPVIVPKVRSAQKSGGASPVRSGKQLDLQKGAPDETNTHSDGRRPRAAVGRS